MSDRIDRSRHSPTDDAAVVVLPECIGAYTIRKLIGEGSMGTVFEAEQAHPHRRVAIKLMRADRLSQETLRRFTIESEVLGRLQHAGIAQIYEAGTAVTNFGTQPFFAMELVEGRPLDRYAAQEQLSIRDRLRLMAKVAEAVQHAHGHGVIHRDLKPANIIVDGAGQPKILDFGVARVIGTDLVNTTAQTEIGTLVGTILYMSPEQTESDPNHIDARSDVYALGVMAYELLAGRSPYDLSGEIAIEAVRIIRQEEPVRLGRVNKNLRGDVETVIAKALEKETAQRYQSAGQLAADLNNLLYGRPISAKPPTIASKVRYWTMREERIRQAGLAFLSICTVVGLFEVFWALFGIAVLLGAPPYSPEVRPVEFVVHCLSWALVMGALAWLAWRVMNKHIPSMWIALFGTTVVLVFTMLVGANILLYDFAGALADVKIRTLLFSFWIPLALVGVVLNCLALMASYRLRRWHTAPTAGRAAGDHGDDVARFPNQTE